MLKLNLMKGSMLDMIFIPVAIFAVAIGIFVAAVLLSDLSTISIFTDTPAGINALAQGTAAVNTFNWGFLIIAFGLGIGAVAYGFLYPSHPIFIVLGIVMLVLSMVTTPIISNAFGTFVSESSMSAVAGDFPLIVWLMGDTLPIFIAVFGFMLLIAMYSRARSGTE